VFSPNISVCEASCRHPEEIQGCLYRYKKNRRLCASQSLLWLPVPNVEIKDTTISMFADTPATGYSEETDGVVSIGFPMDPLKTFPGERLEG
jgi:hypothetical protein